MGSVGATFNGSWIRQYQQVLLEIATTGPKTFQRDQKKKKKKASAVAVQVSLNTVTITTSVLFELQTRGFMPLEAVTSSQVPHSDSLIHRDSHNTNERGESTFNYRRTG